MTQQNNKPNQGRPLDQQGGRQEKDKERSNQQGGRDQQGGYGSSQQQPKQGGFQKPQEKQKPWDKE